MKLVSDPFDVPDPLRATGCYVCNEREEKEFRAVREQVWRSIEDEVNRQRRHQMSVRAKFYVHSITMHKGWNASGLMGTVTLNPVIGGSDENKAFYAATPGGEIKLGTVNEDALKQFAVGDEFYVEFTKAPAAP